MSVWIVEMWDANRERWEPTVGCALAKQDAIVARREWKGNNPDDRFRIAKYLRAPGSQERDG